MEPLTHAFCRVPAYPSCLVICQEFLDTGSADMAPPLTPSEPTVTRIVPQLNDPDYDLREAVRHLGDDDLLAVVNEFFKARENLDRLRRQRGYRLLHSPSTSGTAVR